MTRATTPEPSSALPTSGRRRQLPGAPLLVAAGGARPDRLPVWFMRQAGRSLPEYRALRVGTRMLDACLEPDLAAEITLQPIRRHGVDAAILFSDIVVPLKAAGVDVDIVAGTGPVIANPVRGAADVAALPELTPDQMAPVAAAIDTLVGELGDVPLIGFAGAPLTLASYLVEGGPSRNHERTKALMHGEPDTWHALLARLADLVITALRAQIDAGVDAVQLFDSWAGIVSERDYREFVAPYSARVLDAVAGTVPRWHFGVGTGELLGAMAEPAPGVAPEVVGVDWRVSLSAAAQRVRAARPGRPVVLQGNLDPAMLDAGWPAVERAVRQVVEEGRAADAHIVNLGHGVLPGTDPAVLTRIVELVHSL